MIEEPPPRRRRTIALAAVVVIAPILTGVTWYWYDNVRPLTLREVLEKSAWTPGMRDLEDRIANVTRIASTSGNAIWLSLASDDVCPGGIGSRDTQYRLGDTYRTTMHFRSFTYNGHEAVWAPEVPCPFPILLESMGVVVDAVSTLMGAYLLYEGTDAQGWTTYSILTPNGDRFPADRVNASLRQESFTDLGSPAKNRIDSGAEWVVWAALEYVAISGWYTEQPEIDAMDSLAESSRNGTLRFVDADSDSNVSDGDAIQVRLAETAGGYQTYMLQLGGGMGSRGGLGGVKLILNGPQGPLELMHPWFQILHTSEQVLTETAVVSTLEIGEGVEYEPMAFSSAHFTITPSGAAAFGGPVTESPVSSGNLTALFSDRSQNGLLDRGDRFVISGQRNRTSATLEVKVGSGTNASQQSISWVAGYGLFPGRFPHATLKGGTGPPYEVRASVPGWDPELALNRTIAVSLWENSTQVVDHAPLVNGTVATWANGTLLFEDRDWDAFFTTGDAFTIQAASAARYRLEVSVLWDARVYRVDVGP